MASSASSPKTSHILQSILQKKTPDVKNQGSEFRVRSMRFGIYGSGVCVVGFSVWLLGSKVQGSGFRVYSLVFRGQGLGQLVRLPWDHS